MPRIENRVMVDAPLERVWDVARDVEAFPEIIPDLKSLTVVERSEDGLQTVTDWVAIIKEFKRTVKWREEDIWDTADWTCRFRMLTGDFDQYEGVWTFREEGGKVAFESVIDYEYNVPLLGALIKNIVTAKMTESTENILQAIREKAEAAG